MVRNVCRASVFVVALAGTPLFAAFPGSGASGSASAITGPVDNGSGPTYRPSAQSERLAVRAGPGLALTAPEPDKPAELLASHTDKSSRTTIEIGALGGGRADAPSLVHVGLGWTF